MVTDVKKVIETAELGTDAASEPVMVLDEAAIDNAEEQDCAVQIATEELHEMQDDAKNLRI